MPAAPKIVRRASAVCPCRPITLPTSSGWTHSSCTITYCPSTERTSTSSGWSTRALAIISSSSFMAHVRVCVCISRKLSVRVSRPCESRGFGLSSSSVLAMRWVCRKAGELARNGHSLLASSRILDGSAGMTLWVRWSNTTYSPGDNAISSLMRIFADSRSFTASNQRKLPSGFLQDVKRRIHGCLP